MTKRPPNQIFDAEQIEPHVFYPFTWLEKAQPAHHTPNGKPKWWTITRGRLKKARDTGKLRVCPNNPTLVRGDHLLAWLKGKTQREQTN